MAQAFSIQRQRYAKAFDYLDVELPKIVSKSPDLWGAFKTHSHLAEEEALSAVALNGTPPLIFGSTLGAAVWGQFDPIVPGRIELSTHVLEQFSSDAGNPEAQSFLVAKVLHEICHWGCFRKQVRDTDEAGEEFERQVFGRELGAWWLSGTSPLASPTRVSGDVFLDSSARAAVCIDLLHSSKHVPGRLADPVHSVFGGIDVGESLPRGFRNNNPGNIRATGTAWRGLADPTEMTEFQARESAFCVFCEPEWGLRAMAVILRNYKRKYGLVTPTDIISRWAPAADHNDVRSYSGAIASALGVDPDTVVDVETDSVLVDMLRAIARHENGIKAPYTEQQYGAALKLI